MTVTLPLFKDGHHARRFVKHGILCVSSRNSFPSPAHIGVVFLPKVEKKTWIELRTGLLQPDKI